VTSESDDYLPVMNRTRLVDVVNQIGGAGMHQIKVQLSDKNGHSQMLLSPAETVETIQQNSSSWVYADNQKIDPDQVDEANLSTVSSVRIVSGLVGGC
jgi:hypothetical protein